MLFFLFSLYFIIAYVTAGVDPGGGGGEGPGPPFQLNFRYRLL